LWLYDFYKVTRSKEALGLFNKGIETLENNIYRYDTGSWSLYELSGYKAPEDYHRLHIHQLKALYKITGKKIFKEFAENFEAYLKLL